MNKFTVVILTGLRRLFGSRRNLLLLLLMMLLSLYSVHRSTGEYKQKIAESREFRQLQATIFGKISDYKNYSVYGVQVFLSPGPASIFCSCSSAMNELYAKVNSIAELTIHNNAKTLRQLITDYPMKLRFPFLVLLVGSLACLCLGCSAIEPKEYLKSLASTCSAARVYMAEAVSHVLFIALCWLLIFAVNLGYVLIQNVSFTVGDLAGLWRCLGVTVLMLFFFFFIGTIIGTCARSKWVGRAALIGTWFALVVVIPLAIYSVGTDSDGHIPSPYRLATQKYGILSDFEKKIEDKYGKFNRKNMKTEREIVEGYFNTEFATMMEMEKELRDAFFKNTERKERAAILMPATFYLGTYSEASSYGNRSFIALYDYLIDLQRRFLRFWIDRVYYNDPKVMVPFVKGDENIFKSKSRLPGNFSTGIIVTAVYILLLALISYLAFLKAMYGMKSKHLSKLESVNLDMKDGDMQVFLVKVDHFKNLLFHLLSGKVKSIKKRGFAGKVVVNGRDIAAQKDRVNFLYLCHARSIPGDFRVKDVIYSYAGFMGISAKEKREVLKRTGSKPSATFARLTPEQRFDVLMALLGIGAARIALIHDTALDLPVECAIALKARMEELKKQGWLPIYLSSTNRPDSKPVEMEHYVYEGSLWLYMVEENLKRIELQEK